MSYRVFVWRPANGGCSLLQFRVETGQWWLLLLQLNISSDYVDAIDVNILPSTVQMNQYVNYYYYLKGELRYTHVDGFVIN